MEFNLKTSIMFLSLMLCFNVLSMDHLLESSTTGISSLPFVTKGKTTYSALNTSPQKRINKNEQNILKNETLKTQLIENAIKDATIYLLEGSLEKFDALVGECACQVRAIEAIILFNKIKEFGVDSLTDDEKEFLGIALLLTKSKNPPQPQRSMIAKDSIDLKKIHTNLSTKFGKKLIESLQRRLAELSVQILHKLAREMNDEDLIKALNYVLIDYDDPQFRRPHCATYPSFKLILQYLIKHNHVLMIILNTPAGQKKLFYKNSNNRLMPISSDLVNPKESILVMKAVSNNFQQYEEQFFKLNIIDALMGHLAIDNQFTGQHKNDDVPYEELGINRLLAEKESHKQISDTYGCSFENHDLIFIIHVFATNGEKALLL